MSTVFTLMSTGLAGLDEVLQGINPGDNIVWQIDSIEDYVRFVHPFVREANRNGQKPVYFRFADHPALMPEGADVETHTLHPEEGFETFIAAIFGVIVKKGHGAFYVFDSLSDLSVDWYSDRMLANFFMLTCPYLYDFDTASYFALFRNNHTTRTVKAIHNTAQVIIDLYRHEDEIYVQPLKVDKRYSNTLYMLHRWKGEAFEPVLESPVVSGILKKVIHTWTHFSEARRDMWDKVYMQAVELQEAVERGETPGPEVEETRQRLLRMVVTRDERVLGLADKYFSLPDLIDIGRHMIGTGLVGGKTVGMLLARAILKKQDPVWAKKLEPHDSFFVGSDVFYSYLIMSRCWWARWKQRNPERFLEGAEEAHRRLLSGSFPEDVQDQFKEILDYFGQSPIIVRSSSLLEDAYGNAFSGKYESVFCTNQGTPEERLEEFLDAVRTVYASTMNREALLYRSQRGLLEKDEQMALLVQRVSGSFNGGKFFPQIAGVGFSYNLYVWNKDIAPEAGVLRLVFGLGTRAVDRSDDDYTRIVALNEPSRRPEADFDEVKKFSQRRMDLLDLEKNSFASEEFADVVQAIPGFPVELFATRDAAAESAALERHIPGVYPWVLTFDKLLSETPFIPDIRQMMRTLQEAYAYPVDIEFTANFDARGVCRINLLQCRPYQVRMGLGVIREPGEIPPERILLRTHGPIVGSSIHTAVDRLIYVVPALYGQLPEQERYEVARLIGRVANIADAGIKTIMLVGPGRWGTSTPSLGVPVQFGDISRVSVLCEIAEMHEGLVPEVSLGTHFFNDLVELDILYMAVQPRNAEHSVNRELFLAAENVLVRLLPDAVKWEGLLRVIDNPAIHLNANAIQQKAVCYIDRK